MKIISLEEHLVTPEVRDAWSRAADSVSLDTLKDFAPDQLGQRLEDLGDARLRDMDDAGVDVQVLSLTTPGVQNLDPGVAVPLARGINDLIAATVRSRPDRFEGFATLATPAPLEAAAELRRAVTELGMKGAMLCGRTGAKNLDHPDFRPIFEAASELRTPIYIHPQVPRRAVRDAYYSGFDEKFDLMFAAAGLGWHYETGIQLLRMIFAGVFDRCPDLQVIVGHWGEVVLFYLERVDSMLEKVATKSDRPASDYVRRHVYVTPSGMFSRNYMQRSIEILGVDRILFATDYPYVSSANGAARAFLESATLSRDDKEKIAYGNWERLTGR